MVSERVVVGILAIAAIVVIAGTGCIEKPSAPSEETQPTPTPELEQAPALSPTATPEPTQTSTPAVPEVMTDEEIDSLMQTIEDIEAIESELDIPEIDMDIDFE